MHALEMSALLHRALESRVEYLMGLLAVPGWQGETEPLHQVRVASRRVRSVMDLVRPELYPGFKRMNRRLRRLTRALGSTRELDVHVIYLEELRGKVPGMATGAALEHALEVLESHRARARRAMGRRLTGTGLKRLPDLLEVPSFPDPFVPGDLASDVWASLEPPLECALSPIPGLLDREDVAALHNLRIRVKRLRYTLEVLGEAFPVPPGVQLAQLKELQTALGGHHDLATLEALLQDRYRGLLDRERKTLASGTLEVLAYVSESRLAAFERFRSAALAMPSGAFRASLREGLGLPLEDPS